MLDVPLEENARVVEEFRLSAERLRDRRFLYHAYLESCRCARTRADWAAAREWNRRNRAIAPAGDCEIALHQAVIECETGHSDLADQELGKVVETAERLAASDVIRMTVARQMTQQAIRCAGSRWLEVAERFAEESIADPDAPLWSKWAAATAQASLAVFRSDAAEARRLCDELLPVGRFHEPAWRWRYLALLLRTAGRADEAIQLLREACVPLERGGAFFALHWTHYFLAETLMQRTGPGDSEEALGILERLMKSASATGSVLVERRAAALIASQEGTPAGVARRRKDGLTPREIEVLRLIARGKTNREIGTVLFVSPTTVNAHLRSILRKTATANRAEATAYAFRSGLSGV